MAMRGVRSVCFRRVASILPVVLRYLAAVRRAVTLVGESVATEVTGLGMLVEMKPGVGGCWAIEGTLIGGGTWLYCFVDAAAGALPDSLMLPPRSRLMSVRMAAIHLISSSSEGAQRSYLRLAHTMRTMCSSVFGWPAWSFFDLIDV